MAFSIYLQSVIADYAKQRNRYMLTDLQVEYWEEKGRYSYDPEREPEKKIERLEVLAGLRKYAQRKHVLLAGKAGSGKSTVLGRFRWELAQAALADETQPIPVLVALRSLRHNFGILEAISLELQRGDPDLGLDVKEIQGLLLKRRFFLLLDGANEIPSDDSRCDVEIFRGYFAKTPMVVTSRELSEGLGIEQKLRLCGIVEQQMQLLVHSYLPDNAEVLLRQLKDRLRELAETPLLLELLCDVFDPVTQKIPQSKGELFRAVDAKYSTWKKREGVRTAEKFWQWNGEIMRYLAFVMFEADGTPTGKWFQVERTYAENLLEHFLQGRVTTPGEKAKDWLQDLLDYHLLQSAADSAQIEFHHQLFQEYYAAEYLLHKVQQHPEWLVKAPNRSYVGFQQQYLNLLKWTEALAVMLSLVSDEKDAVVIVDLALQVDWILGARLSGEVKEEFQCITVDLVKNVGAGSALLLELLSKSNSYAAIPELHKLIRDSSTDIRRKATNALDRINSKFSIPVLQNKLDLQPSVKKTFSVVNVLEWIKATEVFKTLPRGWYRIDGYNDKEDSLVVSEDDVARLIMQLQDSDPVVRQGAATSLGKNGSQPVISKLLKYLKHPDSHIRNSAAEALGYSGSDKAVDGLLEALNNSKPESHKHSRKQEMTALDTIPDLFGDSELRKVAAWALGRIGSDKAINALLKALDNTEPEMRTDAAEALGYIGSKKAISASYKALNDSNFWVRWRSARALGDIGSDKGITVLIEASEHSNWIVRKRAAEALANIKSNQSIDALIKALDDPEPEVRENAATALGNISADKAIDALIKAYDKADVDLAWRVVEALGSIRADSGISILLEAVQHSHSYVRGHAAYSLGRFKGNQAAYILTKLSTIISRNGYSDEALGALFIIQSNFQFYNYEIFQLPLEPTNPKDTGLHAKIETIYQRTKQMAEQPRINIGMISGGIQNFAPNQGTQRNTTVGHDNNYFEADTELKPQIADLHQFIAEIEAKYPQIQTEAAANEIIELEIAEVQANDTQRWRSLHQQMLLLKRHLFNPDRHLQAAKATIIEVTKAAYEKSLIAKAIITYIDKLIEEPNYGA